MENLSFLPILLSLIFLCETLPIKRIIRVFGQKLDMKIAMTEQTRHCLFQLTGALRNLASDDSIYEKFNTSGATSELCATLELFSEDLDVISNISRIFRWECRTNRIVFSSRTSHFSIISTSESCCDKITEKRDIYKIFVQLFEKYSGSEEIIVRLTYTMGNVVAKIDSTREKVRKFLFLTTLIIQVQDSQKLLFRNKICSTR